MIESCWLALIGADKVKSLLFERNQITVLLNTVCSMEVFSKFDTLPLNSYSYYKFLAVLVLSHVIPPLDCNKCCKLLTSYNILLIVTCMSSRFLWLCTGAQLKSMMSDYLLYLFACIHHATIHVSCMLHEKMGRKRLLHEMVTIMTEVVLLARS